MTILNRSSDGLFNILIVIYQTITSKRDNSITIKELLELCSPEPIEIGVGSGIRKTVNRWIELGLLSISGNSLPNISEQELRKYEEKISIQDNFIINQNQDLESILASLPKILREIIFSPQNNENFWDSEKCKSADFTRALCWILSQDIYTLSTSPGGIETLENSQLNISNRLFSNSDRWKGFKDWAIFLGFAWNAKNIQIDPTDAIRDYISLIFLDKKELDIDEFLVRLNNYLPVFDKGKYRIEIEDKLDKTNWKKFEENHLSISLSLALKNLENNRIISFDKKSDYQKAYNLTKRHYEKWGDSITHLKYLEV